MKRWQDFNRREQGVLLAGVAIATLYLLWFAIVQPVRQLVVEQRSRNQAVASELFTVRQMVADISALQKAGTDKNPATSGLASLVEKSLRQNHLRMSGYQPGSEGNVSLRFDRVEVSGLLQWIYDLETSHRITVDELAIRPTESNGTVSASLRLRK